MKIVLLSVAAAALFGVQMISGAAQEEAGRTCSAFDHKITGVDQNGNLKYRSVCIPRERMSTPFINSKEAVRQVRPGERLPTAQE